LVIAVILLFVTISIQHVFVVEPSEKVQLFVIL
jgi:hypothetical protein